MAYLEKLKNNYDLSKETTFKLGGPAEFFLEVTTQDELLESLKWAKDNALDINFLGGGSNLLINDNGVKGLVIKFMNSNVKVMGTRLNCGAGLPLANAASTATGNSLSGLEWSVGIPRATIGGAIRGNAGAFGSSICDIVETVEAFDIAKMSFQTLSRTDCDFAYRTSIFKKDKNYLVWSANLRMQKEDVKMIKDKIQEVIEFRNKCYPKLPSAGSVFENLTKDQIKKANTQLFERALHDNAFRGEKIGAGYIIDQCGMKGKKIGGIKISLEHANHIVNTGAGTAEEVVMMISNIKQQARDRFGIMLKEEVQYLGF